MKTITNISSSQQNTDNLCQWTADFCGNERSPNSLEEYYQREQEKLAKRIARQHANTRQALQQSCKKHRDGTTKAFEPIKRYVKRQDQLRENLVSKLSEAAEEFRKILVDKNQEVAVHGNLTDQKARMLIGV